MEFNDKSLRTMMVRHLNISYEGTPIFYKEIEEFVDVGNDSYDGSPIFDKEIEECMNLYDDIYNVSPIFSVESLMSISLMSGLKKSKLVLNPTQEIEESLDFSYECPPKHPFEIG